MIRQHTYIITLLYEAGSVICPSALRAGEVWNACSQSAACTSWGPASVPVTDEQTC